MNSKSYDIAVIGGGIVGCATAMALSKSIKGSVIILEAESELAAHQQVIIVVSSILDSITSQAP